MDMKVQASIYGYVHACIDGNMTSMSSLTHACPEMQGFYVGI